ncbi:flagellar biosynthetic protein FliO [Thalassobacillus hwangdonensis]|uniref:Flagellar protein n=1 Tax=Thalassobacillus hwangdonensis TaxID=546108 RepID=A0ABW3KWD5_9BACI
MEGCGENESGDGGTDSGLSDQAEPPNENESLLWSLVKMFFALLLVLGLIYGLLKFFNKRSKLFGQSRKLENLGGLTLGPNRSVQIVRIADKVFVLGVGDDVNMLTEITDEKVIDELLDSKTEGMDASVIGSMFSKLSKKDDDSTKADASSGNFRQLFDKELSDLKGKRKQMIHRQREGKSDE